MKRRALGVILISSGALLLLAAAVLLPSPNSENNDVPTVEAAEQLYRPIHVSIPEAEISVDVKNAKVRNGKWEVFENVAAYGEGSGLPGQMGNIVISAHDRKELFLPLHEAKLGIKISLLTEKAEYEYEIVEIKEVVPTDISVIAQTPDETLTLYTCTGIADLLRLVVVAKRVKG